MESKVIELSSYEFSPWDLIVQWIEQPPGVQKVMASIPVPRWCHVDQFTLHISLPSLKFTSLFHDDFDSADPSSMQDAFCIWT